MDASNTISSEQKSLVGLSPKEIQEALGLAKSYQGKQIYRWIVRGAKSFDEMSDLPLSLRSDLIASSVKIYTSKVVAEDVDGETGAVKLLLELEDGALIECVMLIDSDGAKTACLSSQVGCAMGCRFCKTGTMGLVRNLKTHEIIEQFLTLSRYGHLEHIVFMGMGEPLANLRAVAPAIRFFNDPDGINLSMRRITVSTCGLTPGIRELSELGLPVKLAVSLVSADNETRSALMPVNKRFPLPELKNALLKFRSSSGRRLTLEYCMLSGVNTDKKAAESLASFTKGLDALVNLIPWNPAEGLPYTTPSTREIETFTAELKRLGVSFTRRFSRGRSINGACGQLATSTRKLKDK